MYLIKSECTPALIYGIEACSTHSSYIKTLDYPIATFMKVFNTKSADVVHDYQIAFGFCSLHEQILTRKINFVKIILSCPNLICSVTQANYAKNDLLTLQNQFANI